MSYRKVGWLEQLMYVIKWKLRRWIRWKRH